MIPGPGELLQAWEGDHEDGMLMLDCLMPNGCIIPLHVHRDIHLSSLKEMLWREAQNYPLYKLLKEKNNYVFLAVNQQATREELVDEDRLISSVRPFIPILKVIEKMGNRQEKLVNSQISVLIGKGLNEFDSMQNKEVSDFRKKMRSYCEKVAQERDSKPWDERLLYLYPPALASTPTLPPHLTSQLANGTFLNISTKLGKPTVTYKFRVTPDVTPEGVVRMALVKRANTTGTMPQNEKHFVLKLCGREEFLLTNHPLGQHECVWKTLARGEVAQFVIVPKSIIIEQQQQQSHRVGGQDAPMEYIPDENPDSHVGARTSWDFPEHQVSLSIVQVQNLHIKDQSKVKIRVGIFHGGDTVCDIKDTHIGVAFSGEVTWNQHLKFNLELCDLPRMARLCFTLYTLYNKKDSTTTGVKVKHGKQELQPICWVNVPFYDYRGELRMDSKGLHMWPISDSDTFATEDILNHIGTVECNPDTKEAAKLTVKFHRYDNQPIFYPSFERVLGVAASHTNLTVVNGEIDPGALQNLLPDEVRRNAGYAEQLGYFIEQTPLHEMTEQEKEVIWKLRYDCQYHFPHSLPKLLSCMEWNNHIHVAQMHALLQIWPALTPQQALELLDFQYADREVRRKAVQWLQAMTDSDLQLYLLQLVQVLKYESYLDCDLVEFLLKRALFNQKVGHALFWILRSEMHIPSVSVRFGLILEAYCRGNVRNNYLHIKALLKQVDALGKLKSVNAVVKSEQYKEIKNQKVKEKAIEDMRSLLKQNTYADTLMGLQSPLDPANWLRQLRNECCKFRDSKKRPLWLIWENQDPYGDDIYIMYKHGDDLRQDMLTLQILRIMDSLWQEEGLDLRLNPYGCLATGYEEGLIEVVLESDTLANIQRKYDGATGAFRKQCIYEWLQEHNKDQASLDKAIEEFTLSCAGYCVATYVLGIGDRHNDNIMIKQNGQLFHIDFGHFLGNFKTKFRIRRERVPFVLTTDFVYIINKGRQGSEGFKRFEETCQRAYMILRQKGNFLLTLFMMMINTGIPQLTSLKDVRYLEDTLALGCTEEEAIKHFKHKFNEALKNGWKTSLNMFAHLLAKDNR